MTPLWIVLSLLPLLGAGERFSCRGRILGGYYADVKSGCRAFHVCVRVAGGGIRDFRFFCPPGTLFQQEAQTCTDWGDDDGLACPADLYDDGAFDLYKIGSGFDTKKVSGAPRDDDEFSLQRAETGDRRLSNQQSQQQSQQSDLRAAHSSDFFSGRRDRGRDDAPETPSPTTLQPSPSTRAPYRRPPPRATPRPTTFAPQPSTPASPISYEPQPKRKIIRKRPVSSTAVPVEYTTASRQYFRSTKPDYVTASPSVPSETPVGSFNEDSGFVDVIKISHKGRYDAPSEKKFNPKSGLTEVYNYNAQSTPEYNNFNKNYNQNNNFKQNNEYRNQNNGEHFNNQPSSFNNNVNKQSNYNYNDQNNNKFDNDNTFNNKDNNFNNQVKPTTQNTNFNENNNYNTQNHNFNNQNNNFNNQVKPTTQNINFNQNNNYNSQVKATTQNTNINNQNSNFNNQNYNNQNNFNPQPTNFNNQKTHFNNNENLNNQNNARDLVPEVNRPFKATVRNHFNVAPVPEFTVDNEVRKNVEVSPNGLQRQSNSNYLKSTNIGSSTPTYRNFNSVSYDDSEKRVNKQTFVNPSTTPNYEKTRNTSPLNLNTVAYKTNVGFDARPANYAESDEDDGQYRLPSGEDDGQYRPEIYERERELLSGAHSINIAASKNQFQEDIKPRRPQQTSQTVAPRPFSVTSTVAPTEFNYPTTVKPQRNQPTYQTYPTTSRPQSTQTISVETSSPSQTTFEYTNSVFTTRRPVTLAYVPTTRAPPPSSTVPPQPFRPDQLNSRPEPVHKPHQRPSPHFAKPPSSTKEDSSYDYAYYDTDTGISEYDQIEEFGKTKSKV